MNIRDYVWFCAFLLLTLIARVAHAMSEAEFHYWMGFFGALVVTCVFCLIVLLADKARRSLDAWRERRAMAKRDAAAAKRERDLRKWNLLAYPPESRRSMRIKDGDIDRARVTGQFSIPRSCRDMKGVHR
jgi:hypothetical protein